jgi:CRP/FNR family transcriptional regulator, cyclic AMP receptor protein
MASSFTSLELHTRTEDVLEHLPVSGTTEYRKGQMIYGPNHLSSSLYLLITGKVGISQTAENGNEVLLEIVRPDELFGESAFLDVPRLAERAAAIEKTNVMTWKISDMEDLVMKRPRLAVALLQILAQRNAEFTRRIESFSIDTIERRLARSLIRFSERLGTLEEDGCVRMVPFTHLLLSRYVGTSRESVTHYMNQFWKQGYVSYSRDSILLYRDTLKTVLDRNGSSVSRKSS